jgi:hypothetical protein
MNELVKLEQSNLVKETAKEGLDNIVNAYIERISFEGGDVEGDYALCEKYIYMLTEMKNGLKPFVETEANKYEGSTVSKFGVSMQAVDTTKFDFSLNQKWVEQKKAVEEQSKKLKEIEAFVKSIKSSTTVVDPETGEITEYFPPVKNSNRTIRASIK